MPITVPQIVIGNFSCRFRSPGSVTGFSCTVKVPSSLFICVFNVDIVQGISYGNGDRFQQVPLAVFDPEGPFLAGDRLRRDSPLRTAPSEVSVQW